tara:strand:- start:9 stop:872 length:864 start_codon:yes stop_codon:yes gene_type:complete
MVNIKTKFLEEELSKKEQSSNFSKFHILPIPLEKTVSYGRGTSKAPEIIINASNQLERNRNSPCDFGIYTHDALDCSLNFDSIFQKLENLIFEISKNNKIPICIGGEHSLTFGVIKGLKKKYDNTNENFGIIQFDAHADLRKTYNGNINSHATVMYKIYKENIPIYQFGVRAQSDEEIKLRDKFNIYFKTIDDYRKNPDIKLPNNFPKNIYITFDSDCLDPSIMPATGTPVPNGLYYEETFLILEKLIKNRRIIGIDYVEYSPIKNFHAYDYISANIIYDLMKLCLK